MSRIIRICLFFCLGLVLPAAFAAAQSGADRKADVTLISERAVAVPGETYWLGLEFELAPKWHIYWTNPGDAGIPPEIVWASDVDQTELQIGSFAWPAPELLPVVEGQIMDYGYSNRVVLPFQITIPETASGAMMLSGVADYLICKDVCIPESAQISLLQSVGSAQQPDTASSADIADALARVPPKFTGETALSLNGAQWTVSLVGEAVADLTGALRFFPFGHEIVHAAEQTTRSGADGVQIDLTPDGDVAALPETLSGVVQTSRGFIEITAQPGALLAGTSGRSGATSAIGSVGTTPSLPFLLVFGLIGGLILNLMPCVLPVLSIKAMGIVSAVAEGDSRTVRAHGLWYTAGVLLSFAALAGAILAIRAATGIAIWGFWLQNPLIVTALILIIFLIGLWLLGMFELGSSVQAVGSGLAAKQGSAGAFFTGVLAAVVGAPCTGPFLGAALGAVMLQPAPIVMLVLLSIGFGLALPFLLLSFVPGLQKLIPKPGAWMESLKQVFAFPMFLTAAWLISVLGSLSGYRVAAAVVAGAALISFGVWAAKSAEQGGKAILMAVLGLLTIVPVFGIMSAVSSASIDILALLQSVSILLGMLVAIWVVSWLGSGMTRRVTRLSALIVALAGFALPLSLAMTNTAADSSSSQAYAAANYPTEAWSPDRVAELIAQDRPIFVDFTAEWCVTCQANKLQTLQTAPVADAFEAGNVAFLVADFTNFDTDIALELQAHGRAGVPLYLWYSAGESDPSVLPELLSIDLVTGLAAGAN